MREYDYDISIETDRVNLDLIIILRKNNKEIKRIISFYDVQCLTDNCIYLILNNMADDLENLDKIYIEK